MSSSDPSSMPSFTPTSVLVLHSTCHEKDATAIPEMAAFESAWRQLVATAKLSCDMILIPDMAVAQQQHQPQQQQPDTHRSVVKFRNELLDPCGTYNVFTLSNLVADSYILSLTDCRLRPIASMPSSSDILLPALAVPSTFHFTWNVSEVFQADTDANVNTNSYAEIRVDLDVTKAKRQFRKVWQKVESAKMISAATTTTTTTTATNATVVEQEKEDAKEEARDQHEHHYLTSTETQQVPPALVDNESHSHVPIVDLPSCPAWEMPLLPPTRTGSISHDPHFKHLETLMESELNDINRILSFLAVSGLVLFVSFLWTAFVHVSHTQSHSRSRASHTPQKTPGTRTSKYKQHRQLLSTRTVPVESISMEAISGGAGGAGGAGNLSPLSLDTILAAQGNCHRAAPSSPSAFVLPLRQVKTARVEETSANTLSYGPKQRSSRRSRQPPLPAAPNKNKNSNKNEADPSLSPCSKLAQQWSRDKSARRNLRRDGANRGCVEASSSAVAAEGLATVDTTTTTTAATTETTKFHLTPVQLKAIRGRSGIAAVPDISVPFYGKSNDSFALVGSRVGAAGHAVPTEHTSKHSTTSIGISEKHVHPYLQLPPATVTPGPTPRFQPAPSTLSHNHDSSFVHEYWGARAM